MGIITLSKKAMLSLAPGNFFIFSKQYSIEVMNHLHVRFCK